LPVPFEHWGFQRAAVLSRNLLYAAVAAAIFGALARIFRARAQSAEPIMLAIAAVTLSTLHQSSLGSLYLLIPNMLAPQWWSPVMPAYFFLSSIVAGTALVILIDMWIAKGWRRPLQITRLLARTGGLHAVDSRVGISVGLIAATIFLFGMAVRYLPVLSKPEPSEAELNP
jgi:formate dehydrogenase iron-sulfur subunit